MSNAVEITLTDYNKLLSEHRAESLSTAAQPEGSSKASLHIPLNPNTFSVSSNATPTSINLIQSGEVKKPRGRGATGYAWSGMFPGKHMKDFPGVQHWKDPDALVKQLKNYLANGTILRLMVSGPKLSINTDVFIESFAWDYSGGNGDVSYKIALTEDRKLVMKVVPPKTSGSGGDKTKVKKEYVVVKKGCTTYVRTGPGMKNKTIGTIKSGKNYELLSKSSGWYKIPYKNTKGWVGPEYTEIVTKTIASSASTRKKPSASGTYTVKPGDTLYKIAKQKLKKGNRYQEIYKLNKAAIDAKNKGKNVDRYTIYPGQKLKLPDQ